MILNRYVNELIKYMPNFNVEIIKDNIVLKGKILLNSKGSVRFYKEFDIKIIIPDDYPKTLPSVYEVSNILDKSYHINPDNSLCLSTNLDIRLKLYPKYNLIDYIDYFTLPFLYNSFFYTKYKISPYGERSHGNEGIVEFFTEYFNLNKIDGTVLFQNLNKRKFKRKFIFKKSLNNYLCPCGSNKKINNCHKESIKNLKNILKKEGIQIISDTFKYLSSKQVKKIKKRKIYVKYRRKEKKIN